MNLRNKYQGLYKHNTYPTVYKLFKVFKEYVQEQDFVTKVMPLEGDRETLEAAKGLLEGYEVCSNWSPRELKEVHRHIKNYLNSY